MNIKPDFAAGLMLKDMWLAQAAACELHDKAHCTAAHEGQCDNLVLESYWVRVHRFRYENTLLNK